ncbi:MAG: extracellular solute-binding protein, partial [Pseudomonadota bacterium]|nr:extracellular solute-binding protein [Pseudomonadota bacterium]
MAAAALPVAGLSASRLAAETRPETKVLDFTTSADMAKAEQEGTLLFYTQDGQAGGAAVVDAFNKDFPKIKASYVRLQNGALYSKILAERSAGRFDVDVIQFSEIGTAIDFQKRGGYAQYLSPQLDAYPTDQLSN